MMDPDLRRNGKSLPVPGLAYSDLDRYLILIEGVNED